jgi:aspartate racemase
LLAVQPNGSKPPFFWVHGDHSFGILAAYLGQDQPLYGLDHQSQDGRLARYTRVEDIAAHYLREARSAQPRGPYCLAAILSERSSRSRWRSNCAGQENTWRICFSSTHPAK